MDFKRYYPNLDRAQSPVVVERLVAVLRSLDPVERDLLNRFYIQGQPDDEIARDLAIPVEMVTGTRSRLRDVFGQIRNYSERIKHAVTGGSTD